MKTFIRLGVNVDHCATVREARYRGYERRCGEVVEPDPVVFALMAERAGADGITVHPRADQRHVQQHDVLRLREMLQIPLNMEMGCTHEMIDFALKVQPRTVCLVPETREEVTTEGGLDIVSQRERVAEVVSALQPAGISISFFIDPEPAQIACAAEFSVPYVEMHTGAYANSWHIPEQKALELAKIQHAVTFAHESGITVNLGHGINYSNVYELAAIGGIHEMNIGHTIVARALLTGVEEAVREMRKRMNPGLC